MIDGKKQAVSEVEAIPAKKEIATKIHIVRGGETFYAIASKYDMSVNELLKLNGLTDAAFLSVGQELKVVNSSNEEVSIKKEEVAIVKEPEVAKGKTSTHTVKAGESFYGIARQYELTVDELLKMNELNSDAVLSIGQELLVDARATKKRKVANQNPQPVTKKASVHQVEAGESFYGIARKYGITVDELLKLNDLSADAVLSIGQELKIAGASPVKEEKTNSPEPKAGKTTVHEVKAGDTMYSIARKYKMTVDELKQLNDKTDNSLSLGDKLKVYQ